MQTTHKTHWLDDPGHVRLLWRCFVVVLVLLVLAELLLHMHPHFAIDSLFAFAAWFGFVACAALIVAAKVLALWLKRPDGHYRDGDAHD